MSIYNKPDLKINIGCNTPSVCHKKINSVNFSSSNTNRYVQPNAKKYIARNQLDLKNSTNSWIEADRNLAAKSWLKQFVSILRIILK